MRVHQAMGSAGPYDAVTEQALAYRALLETWGIAGGMHATVVAPGVPAQVDSVAELDPAPEDLVLIHYSGYLAGMEPLLRLPQRKLLVYHNVTPARYFWRVEPSMALACELGRQRLGAWVRSARVTAAVSEFNARELRERGAPDPHVVPILFDPDRLNGARAGAAVDSEPLVLSVGRLTPHKRPDLVIRAFALFQRHHAPGARLLCVGPAVNPSYLRALEDLVERVGALGVRLAGGLPQPQLNEALREAAVFLSLSEHEGFCVPLLEAMHARLPVVARRSGGMPEVGGDAVLWLDGEDDLAVAAELLHLTTTDGQVREELRDRAAARVEHFARDRVAERLRRALEVAQA